MIKFFRKIRRKLLSARKFRSYLGYAIGEIILVVIGILIAIQINNLNTEKRDTNTLNGYLKNIQENIKVNDENLAAITDFRDSSIVGSQYFMAMVEEEPISRAQFVTYFSQYFNYNPWLDEAFQADKSGFEALKNSGFLSKLQQTPLESKLYKYYSLIEKLRAEEHSLNNFMEEMEYDMYKNNIVQQTKAQVKKLFRQTSTPDDLNLLQQLVNYPAFVGSHSRNAGAGYLKPLYEELAASSTDLQAEIDRVTGD